MRSAAAETGRSAGAIVPGLFASIALTGSVASGRRLLAEFSQANYGMPVEQLDTIQAVAAGPAEYLAKWLIKLKPLLATGRQGLVRFLVPFSPDAVSGSGWRTR